MRKTRWVAPRMTQRNAHPTRELVGRALANFLELSRGLSAEELDDRFRALPPAVRAAIWLQLVAAVEAKQGGGR